MACPCKHIVIGGTGQVTCDQIKQCANCDYIKECVGALPPAWTCEQIKTCVGTIPDCAAIKRCITTGTNPDLTLDPTTQDVKVKPPIYPVASLYATDADFQPGQVELPVTNPNRGMPFPHEHGRYDIDMYEDTTTQGTVLRTRQAGIYLVMATCRVYAEKAEPGRRFFMELDGMPSGGATWFGQDAESQAPLADRDTHGATIAFTMPLRAATRVRLDMRRSTGSKEPLWFIAGTFSMTMLQPLPPGIQAPPGDNNSPWWPTT